MKCGKSNYQGIKEIKKRLRREVWFNYYKCKISLKINDWFSYEYLYDFILHTKSYCWLFSDLTFSNYWPDFSTRWTMTIRPTNHGIRSDQSFHETQQNIKSEKLHIHSTIIRNWFTLFDRVVNRPFTNHFMHNTEKWSYIFQKSHTWQEDGAQLRTSVWHLLMNLKNNYLFKKTCWGGPTKNLRILTFTMLYFLKD